MIVHIVAMAFIDEQIVVQWHPVGSAVPHRRQVWRGKHVGLPPQIDPRILRSS